MSRQKYRLAVAALTVVGLALRIVVPLIRFRHAIAPIGDRSSSTAAWIQANLFADGKGFVDPDIWRQTGRFVHSAAAPPLYSILLGTAAFLGAHSVVALRIVSAVISATAIPVMARLGLHLGGARLSLLAAGLVAVHPNLWIDSGLLRPETLLVPILGLVVLTALRMADSPSFGRAAGLGATIGLGALCRVDIALLAVGLAVPIALWSCRADAAWSRRIAWSITSIAVTAVVFLPWLMDSRHQIGVPFAASGTAGYTLQAGSCATVTSGELLGETDPRCLPNIDPSIIDPAAIDRARWDAAISAMEDDRLRFAVVVMPARVGRTFGVFHPLQTNDIDDLFEQRGVRIGQLGLALHALVSIAAVIGLAVRLRAHKPILPFTALIGLSMFTAAVAGGHLRYRVTADVALVLLAAIGIDGVIVWLADRRRSGEPAGLSPSTPGDPTGGVWSA